MLVADGVYARHARRRHLPRRRRPPTRSWPIAYFLLAAAVMHPSMRKLWEGERRPGRHGRARMVVLGAALFAAPAVVILDDSGSSAAVVLAVDHRRRRARRGVAHHASGRRVEPGPARDRARARPASARSVQHATDVIIVVTEAGTVQYISPAVEHVVRATADELDGDSLRRLPRRERGRPDPGAVPDAASTTPTSRSPPSSTCPTGAVALDRGHLDQPAARAGGPRLRRQPPGHHRPQARRSRSPRPRPRVLELILSGAPVPETLSALLDALEAYVPDGVGLHPAARPRTPDARVRRGAEPARPSTSHEVREHTTDRGHRGVPERHRAAHPARHRARGCSARDHRPVPLVRAPRPVVDPDPHARRQRVPRAARLLPAHRPRPAGRRAGGARTGPRPRRPRHRPRRPHQGARTPRAARHAHRPAQPRARPGPARARARPPRQHRRRRDGRGAVRRPRPLQAGERRARPRDRRRAPGRGEPAAERRPSGARTPSPASAATSSSCCAKTCSDERQADRARRARRAGVPRAVRALARRGDGVGEHRHRGHQPVVRSRRRTCCRTPTPRCTAPSGAVARATSCSTRPCTPRPCRGCSPSARSGGRSTTTSCACCSSPSSTSPPASASRSRPCCAGTTPCGASWSPGDFLRVAEETGIIVPIGEWVLGSRVRARPVAPQHARRRRAADGLDQRLGPPAAAPRLPRARRARVRDCGRRPDLVVPRGRRELRCSTTSTPPAMRSARSRTSACSSPSTTSAPAARRSPTCAGSRSTS